MNHRTISLLVIIGCAGLSACKPQAVQPPAPPAAVTVTDEIRSQLVFADTADGKTDHVIQKCVTCNLYMPGKPKFAVIIGEYRVQLCSTECKAAFEKDPTKALIALPTTGN